MAVEDGHGFAMPSWFVSPGEADTLAWISLAVVGLALYGLITLYAAFDRWAEQKSHGTPLAKTIPTMLFIALLYEVFPLGHFNILLPISAILIALMADWSRYHLPGITSHTKSEMDALGASGNPPHAPAAEATAKDTKNA